MTIAQFRALFPTRFLIVKWVQSRGEYWTATTEDVNGADGPACKGNSPEEAIAALVVQLRDAADESARSHRELAAAEEKFAELLTRALKEAQ